MRTGNTVMNNSDELNSDNGDLDRLLHAAGPRVQPPEDLAERGVGRDRVVGAGQRHDVHVVAGCQRVHHLVGAHGPQVAAVRVPHREAAVAPGGEARRQRTQVRAGRDGLGRRDHERAHRRALKPA